MNHSWYRSLSFPISLPPANLMTVSPKYMNPSTSIHFHCHHYLLLGLFLTGFPSFPIFLASYWNPLFTLHQNSLLNTYICLKNFIGFSLHFVNIQTLYYRLQDPSWFGPVSLSKLTLFHSIYKYTYQSHVISTKLCLSLGVCMYSSLYLACFVVVVFFFNSSVSM